MIAGAVPVAVLVLAFLPAAAGASALRPPVALTAVPAQLTLQGSTEATVRIRNSGTKRAVVDVTRAGFALDLRGRPRIVRRDGARSAPRWLVLRPQQLVLRPGGSGLLAVASKVPSHAEPGDHDALVLVTSRPRARARVAVRLRLGIVVVVRAPGRVERRLRLGPLRVVRRGRLRLLELFVANRGNVTESAEPGDAVVSLAKDGRRFATLRAASRRFRPRTSGIVQFRYRGSRRGWVTARVVVLGEPGDPGRSALRRTYRIRL